MTKQYKDVGYGAGDEDPWDFFQRFLPYIKKQARLYAEDDHDMYEWLMSEARQRWQSIYDNWIPELGTLFTHMKANIRGYFGKARHHERRAKQRYKPLPEGTDVTIADTTVQHDSEDQVNYLLQSLNDDDRRMIMLHIKGWTFEEIGNVFSLTRFTARNRVSRIMARLRALHNSPKTHEHPGDE